MQLPQCRARFDAQFVEQRAPCLLVGRECVCLTAATVKSDHQLPAQSLAQRILSDQRLELAHQVAVAAERQIGVDAQLERDGTAFFQPGDLAPRERLVRDVRQRRSAPQRESLAQPSGRIGGAPVLQCRGRIADELLEAVEVKLTALHAKLIGVASRLQPLPRTVAERTTQLADVVLQHLHGRRGRSLAPQRVDEPVGRYRRVAMQQQEDQDAALAARPSRTG